MLVAFVLLERHQKVPMLDLSLFKSGTFTGSILVVLLVALAMFGVFFFVSLYMQNILGYSPVQTGAAFLPMTIMVILVAPIAGKASDRIGSRVLMTVGMSLLALQLFYFSRLGLDTTFWNLLPGFIIGGIGMSLTMTPSAAAAIRSVPVDKSGVGSAVLNAGRQVGGSVGHCAHGRDRRVLSQPRNPESGRVHGRLFGRINGCGRNRVGRSVRRGHSRPPARDARARRGSVGDRSRRSRSLGTL